MVPFLQHIYHWYLCAIPIIFAHRNIPWHPSSRSCMESLQSHHPLLFLPSAAPLPQSIGLNLYIPFSHNLTISLSTFYWMWLLKTIKNIVAWSPSASPCVLTQAWEITHCLQSLPCLFVSCLHLHTAHTGLQCLTSLAPWYSSCQLSNFLSFICSRPYFPARKRFSWP